MHLHLNFNLLLLLLFALLLGAVPSFAASPDTQWDVRVEVMMVSMPEAKALALLPALRDPDKIAAASAQILDAIGRNEATLMGYPVVETASGVRGVSESRLERRYPTDFEKTSGTDTRDISDPATSGSAAYSGVIPTDFETRNVGVTLDVTPTVTDGGKWICLDIAADHVDLSGFDNYRTGRHPDGTPVVIPVPQFHTEKATTGLNIRNGTRKLIGIHKLLKPDGQIEFFILQAFATSGHFPTLQRVSLGRDPKANAKIAARETAAWSVRAEVWMVALPQAKALALLPEFRDPSKTGDAVSQVMAAIGSKDATLLACPLVETLEDERTVAEEIIEKRYPSQFIVPSLPQNIGTPPVATGTNAYNPIPYSFETRNIGVTFEVEPRVSPDGAWLSLDMVPQRVDLNEMETFDVGKTPDGSMVTISQPQFHTNKVTCDVNLRSGAWKLIGVHKLFKPEGQFEFFILHADATPAR